jgi:hypothetical protein
VIGKKGEDVEKLRQDLTKQMGVPVHINIEEIRKPELDGMLVAQSVAQQLVYYGTLEDMTAKMAEFDRPMVLFQL